MVDLCGRHSQVGSLAGAEPTWKLLLVPSELLNVAVPLPLKETEPGDEAEIVN